MNRESIVTGLLGLGLGLTLCSVILALTFSKVAKGEELTWTYGTYMVSINWVWLSDLFLTCGLGMFAVSSFIPLLKKVSLKTLLTSLPFSAFYLLMAAFDVVTTHVLVKSGLGNEVNPIMALLINTFGVSYALSLNFALSLFIIIGLMYFTEKLHLFSAVVLPISFVRGLVVYNNMKVLEGYTLNLWFVTLRNSLIENVPMIILFSLSVALGATIAFAFPEEEGKYSLISGLKSRLRVGSKSEYIPTENLQLPTETIEDEQIDPIEFTLLLERFRIKQEVVETLLDISREISRKKGIPMNQVTLQDVIEELKRRS